MYDRQEWHRLRDIEEQKSDEVVAAIAAHQAAREATFEANQQYRKSKELWRIARDFGTAAALLFITSDGTNDPRKQGDE